MLELLFIGIETGLVNYAVTDVAVIRHITPSEVGFTYQGGRISSCAFLQTERLEVVHKTNSPAREALRMVEHA